VLLQLSSIKTVTMLPHVVMANLQPTLSGHNYMQLHTHYYTLDVSGGMKKQCHCVGCSIWLGQSLTAALWSPATILFWMTTWSIQHKDQDWGFWLFGSLAMY
jgi:hypothetical protein